MKKFVHFFSDSQNLRYFTVYWNEIIETLFSAEKKNIKIAMKSDQMSIRPRLVELLKVFALRKDYSLATLHLAIYILDIYMDNYVISDYYEHQKLIGLICLLLAAKTTDLDELVPSIKDLLRICDLREDLDCDLRFKEELPEEKTKSAYKKFAKMYCKIEFLIFEAMEFNTIRPTVATFINVFQFFLVTEDDTKHRKYPAHKEISEKALDYVKQFLDLILSDVAFFNIVPSLLAASIVGATRKLLQFDDYWNEKLVSLTRYKVDQIRSTMILLVDKRHNFVYRQIEVISSDEDTDMKNSGLGLMIKPGNRSGSRSSDEYEAKPEIKRRRLNRPKLTLGAI